MLKVPPGYLTGYETVFAMTVNKSQGSEADRILVLLPEQKEIQLLTRELLYTAVTRAKKQVLVQGTQEVLEHAIRQKITRISGLEARLQNKTMTYGSRNLSRRQARASVAGVGRHAPCRG